MVAEVRNSFRTGDDWDVTAWREPELRAAPGHACRTRKPGIRTLGGLAVALELVELPLFALAFGVALAALLSIRTILAVVLAVFTVRGQPVARAVLGALRVLAASVAIGMAPLVEGNALFVAAMVAAGAGDVAVGLVLLMRRPQP